MFTQFNFPELKNFTVEQVNKIARNMNEVDVIDKKELFELFF